MAVQSVARSIASAARTRMLVFAYPLRRADHALIFAACARIHRPLTVVTLTTPLPVILRQRGKRRLDQQEQTRVRAMHSEGYYRQTFSTLPSLVPSPLRIAPPASSSGVSRDLADRHALTMGRPSRLSLNVPSTFRLVLDALPPYDRAIALACRLGTFRARWLYTRCQCGHSTPRPVRLMLREQPGAAGQTLADVLVRLRCDGCQRRGWMTVHLCETAHGAGPASGTVRRGWALLLHDGAAAPAGSMARAGE